MKLRAYAAGKTKAVGERQIRVIVSTPTVDRHGDIVDVAGIDLAAYKKNPIVLCQHRHSEPIARCPEIKLKGKRLEAIVEFPEAGVSAKSDEVYGLIKAEVLNAVSIGFIPKEWENLDDKEPWRGRRYTKSEMIEFSVVSVPANPDALIMERGLLDAEEQIALARANLTAMRCEPNAEPEDGAGAPEPEAEEETQVEEPPEDTSGEAENDAVSIAAAAKARRIRVARAKVSAART